MPPVIVSAENAGDNATAFVTLATPPVGALQFFISPIPEEYGQPVSFVEQGGNLFRVVAFPGELAYITAQDEEGVSRSLTGDFTDAVAVWIHGGEGALSSRVEDILGQLQQRILNNRTAIQARMRLVYPEATLKQVVFTLGEQITGYPAIELHCDSLGAQFFASDFYQLHPVQVTLSAYVFHNDPQTESRLLWALGDALMMVLNHRGYEQMTLATGEVLTRCSAGNLRFAETVLPSQGWLATAVLSWSAEWGGSPA